MTSAPTPTAQHLGLLALRGGGLARGRLQGRRLVAARFVLPAPEERPEGLDAVAFAEELLACPQLGELEDLSLGIDGDADDRWAVLTSIGRSADRFFRLRRLRVGPARDGWADDLLPGWALGGHAVGDGVVGAAEPELLDLRPLGGLLEQVESLLVAGQAVRLPPVALERLTRVALVSLGELQGPTVLEVSRLRAPRLQELVVACRGAAVDVTPFLSASWSNLRRLALRHTLGTDQLLWSILGPPLWPRLTELDLSQGTLQDGDIGALLRQRRWPELLDLTANQLSPGATHALREHAGQLGTVVVTGAQRHQRTALLAHFWRPGERYHQVRQEAGEAPIVVAALRRDHGAMRRGQQVFVVALNWGRDTEAQVVAYDEAAGAWQRRTVPPGELVHARLRRLTNPDVLGLIDGAPVARELVDRLPAF